MKIFKKLYIRKAEVISETIKPFAIGRIIDIGAGRGLIAKRLKEKTGCDITLLDIDPYLNETDLSYSCYHPDDNMPFKDNEFDTSLLIYVLHHCYNPVITLKEAIRITKKRIIIIEDMPDPLAYIFDFISNSILNNTGSFYHFKKDKNWKKLFNILGLKLIAENNKPENFCWYYPVRHKMYVLEK